MHKYIALHKGKRIEIEASTSYEAQIKATKLFKAKKSYDVTIYLVETENGDQVTHTFY